MAESRVRPWKEQDEPGTHCDRRKSSKTDGDMPKGYRGQFERDSTGYIKNKLENQFNALNKKVIILVQIWQTKQMKKRE